jgi:hypothetical protein
MLANSCGPLRQADKVVDRGDPRPWRGPGIWNLNLDRLGAWLRWRFEIGRVKYGYGPEVGP